MRNITIGLLSLLLGLLSCSAYAQGYAYQANTPDDAKQLLRNFEGDPSLQLTQGLTDSPLPMGNFFYNFSSGDYEYSILNDTRDQINRYDKSFGDQNTFYGQPYDPNALAPQAMAQADAEAIARAFLQTHFPDPQWLNAMSVEPQRDTPPKPTDAPFTKSYKFKFSQDCGNGVQGPSRCYVEVDTIFGKIVDYSASHYPLLISPVPNLTQEQAVACLLNAVQATDVQSAGVPAGEPLLRVTTPDAPGMEQLEYGINFIGAVNGQYDFYRGYVDAKTGATNGCRRILVHGANLPSKFATSATILALQAKMAYRRPAAYLSLTLTIHAQSAGLMLPPLLINHQPYLYVGYLCYGAKNVKLTYTDRDHILVHSPERDLRFSLNTTAYTRNGQTKRLSAKPIIVADRCYVPLETAQGVLPFQIAYDAAKRQVHFDALPAAIKSADIKRMTAPLPPVSSAY